VWWSAGGGASSAAAQLAPIAETIKIMPKAQTLDTFIPPISPHLLKFVRCVCPSGPAHFPVLFSNAIRGGFAWATFDLTCRAFNPFDRPTLRSRNPPKPLAAIACLHNNPECDKNPRSSVFVRTTFGVFTPNYTGFQSILEQAPAVYSLRGSANTPSPQTGTRVAAIPVVLADLKT
jgi:hypothetical protein